MASAMRVLNKFRASDGRIKVATLSGVSALVAVIALLVGVLPVMADHESSAIDPGDPIQYGGGSGACDFVASAADNELHINNPANGTFTGPDGTEISITVTGNLFSFDVVTPGIAVYDVVVNGGAHNLHYDYEGSDDGAVTSDVDLHAPKKNNGDLFNLSHINICYDFDTQFECGVTEVLDPEGQFDGVEATIFTNSNLTCPDDGKIGSFFSDEGTVNIDFGSGTGDVAGKAIFPKEFDSGADIVPLQYRLNDSVSLVNVEWCNVREKVGDDGNEFDTWLGDDYPSLVGVTDEHTGESGPAIACKVYEEEYASGIQFTVVYFEFEDPQFR